MNLEILGLILDGAVLVSMGVGVYFAVKITRVLDNFKKARKEMTGMVQALTEQIHLADKAIESLKYESYETADELRGLIKKAAPLAGELKVMSEAGGHVADRLEEANKGGAAPPAREAIQPMDWGDDDGFAIRDDDGGYEDDDLQSEAERELFKVLKGTGGR